MPTYQIRLYLVYLIGLEIAFSHRSKTDNQTNMNKCSKDRKHKLTVVKISAKTPKKGFLKKGFKKMNYICCL